MQKAVERIALERKPTAFSCAIVELAHEHQPFIAHVDLLHEGEIAKDHALAYSVRSGAEILMKAHKAFRVEEFKAMCFGDVRGRICAIREPTTL